MFKGPCGVTIGAGRFPERRVLAGRLRAVELEVPDRRPPCRIEDAEADIPGLDGREGEGCAGGPDSPARGDRAPGLAGAPAGLQDEGADPVPAFADEGPADFPAPP